MKKLLTAYSFDPTAKTITLTRYVGVDHAGLLLVTNVTDNIIIYNFADPAKGGTVAGNIISLTYDTSGMEAGDNLQIFYEDGLYDHLTNSELRDTPVPVSGEFFPVTQPVSGPLTDAELRDTPLPVTGEFYPLIQPVLGPLTDTELRDAPIPVEGAFYPETQPVSLESAPLPAGAAEDGTDITTPEPMPAGGAGIRGWLSAIWTKLNGTLGVTGTFWQETQPVSGTVGVSNFPATQPVSLASAPLPTGAATSAKQDDIVDEILNKDLMMAIRVLLQQLANPAWMDKSANQLRAQVTGVLTTVSTVTTVTGVTNFGGYPAQQGIIDANRTAWATVVRGRIT